MHSALAGATCWGTSCCSLAIHPAFCLLLPACSGALTRLTQLQALGLSHNMLDSWPTAIDQLAPSLRVVRVCPCFGGAFSALLWTAIEVTLLLFTEQCCPPLSICAAVPGVQPRHGAAAAFRGRRAVTPARAKYRLQVPPGDLLAVIVGRLLAAGLLARCKQAPAAVLLA